MQKNLTLQAYRGVAALLVALFHVGEILTTHLGPGAGYFFGNFFSFGWAAVDLFFVLSGYILVRAHWSDLGSGSLHRGKVFLIKRFCRLYPFYWLVLGSLTVVTFFSGDTLFLSKVLASAFLVPDPGEPILAVAWSLEHEAVFCLFLFFGITLRPKVSLLLGTLWLATVAFSAQQLVSVQPSSYLQALSSVIFNPLNIEFFFGASLGLLVARLEEKDEITELERFAPFLIVSGGFLFMLSGMTLVYADMSLPSYVSFGIPSSLLVLGGAVSSWRVDEKKMVHKTNQPTLVKVAAPWTYLGDASYAIYLAHGPTLVFGIKVANNLARETLLAHSLVTQLYCLSLVAAAVGIGIASHYLIERPMISCSKRILMSKRDASSALDIPTPSPETIL